MLNQRGLEQVRPLSGGIDTWKARRYPLEKRILPPAPPSSRSSEARGHSGGGGWMRMRLPGPIRLGVLSVAAPALWLAYQARVEAQVDEGLVTRRWTTSNFWADTYDKPILTSRGHLEGTDEHIQIFHWYSEGRIKFDKMELDPPEWIGYRAFTISVDSEV